MNLAFTAIVFLFTICCAPSSQSEHLVPKHGLESRHSIVKRDLTETDMEMILKKLMSKLEHGAMDSEFKHPIEHEYIKEAVPLDKVGYEMKKDLSTAEKGIHAMLMKIKELDASKTLDDSYKKDIIHGTPEERFISEKVHSSLHPVRMDKSEKMFKDVTPEDKFGDKDVSLAESLYHMKIAGDIETYPSIKFEDMKAKHDMGMAEEKLHLEKTQSEKKTASDEAYLKKVDEISKSFLKEETYKHLVDDDIDGYLKKAAEVDKSSHYYDPKMVHQESTLKASEEKAIEGWKAGHKDVFAAEEGYLLEKELKAKDAHHAVGSIDHEMGDEMIKKLKSLGLDKELSKEDEELLLLLSKELHKSGIEEGTHAFEKAKEQAFKDSHIHTSGEDLKWGMDKAQSFGEKGKIHGSELLFEKGLAEEKIHGINSKIGSGIEKSLHGIIGEGIHKSKETHAFDEAYGIGMEKTKFGSKIPLEEEFKHAISHEIPHKIAESGKEFKIHDEEFLKKEKTVGIDAMLHKSFEDELLKKGKAYGVDDMLHKAHGEESLKTEKAYGTDAMLHKAHEDELLKKEKAFGSDAFFHKAHEEDLLKKEKAYGTDAMLHKAHEDELLKKEKAFGTDAFFHKAHEEDLLKKEKAYGTDAMLHKAHEDELLKKEKAFGSDAFFHKAHEEELLKKEKAYGTDAMLHKAHEDELLKKEKAFGTDAFFHKAHEEELLKKEKAYGTDSFLPKAHEEELLKKGKAFGIDDMLHKAHEDEILKKGKTLGTDAMFHKAHEEEHLKKEKAHGTDDIFHKVHDGELIKKEIAYGSDASFHKNKEILGAAEDHHFMHGVKNKEAGIFHDVTADKHLIEESIGETEKSHKSLSDLKAKFFELLKRVLQTRKCHLVTMRPGELLSIINCISRSKDPLLCEKFAMCEKKMPIRVMEALEKCQKETIPGAAKKCTTFAPLYPSTEIPLKIFQCTAINVRELMPEEKKHMIEFEECARVVKTESCGRFNFFRRPL